MKPVVVIESRYAGGGGFNQSENIEFAQRLCARAVEEGFNPVASHLFYPQFLDDRKPADRQRGIQLGFERGAGAKQVWIALRVGEEPSEGVSAAFAHWLRLKKHVLVLVCHPDGEIIGVREELNKPKEKENGE